MTRDLDLGDIQGNIVRAYGRYGYPFARYFLFHIGQPEPGRAFVKALLPRVTTAERWADPRNAHSVGGQPRPPVTLNVAFSWEGLAALNLPTETLSGFPAEFIDGMARRADILSDTGPSGHHRWDPVWRAAMQGKSGSEIHLLITINSRIQEDGTPVPELEEMTDWLRQQGAQKGISLLSGHGQDGQADFQQAGASLLRGKDGVMRPDAREHFGYEDGIGNPVFEGQYPPHVEAARVIGRGKIMPDQTWKPLATGEFLLGHVDESQELPDTTSPALFTKNGTYVAFRKLHENVGSFQNYIDEQAKAYASSQGISQDQASMTLRAKMVGRWPDGIPLMAAPTFAEHQALLLKWSDIPAIMAQPGRRTPEAQARLDAWNQMLIDFKYRDDQQGARCPMSAHIRRGNMRDMLDPRLTSPNPKTWDGSALTNRRRIMRRGLPYGAFQPDVLDDTAERGVIFIAMCSNISRQFEFVLQQWINYGMDLNLGNDTCPLLGPHNESSKFIVPAEPGDEHGPWVMNAIPQFVETRGGEYFFAPSLSTLGDIARGSVDPT